MLASVPLVSNVLISQLGIVNSIQSLDLVNSVKRKQNFQTSASEPFSFREEMGEPFSGVGGAGTAGAQTQNSQLPPEAPPLTHSTPLCRIRRLRSGRRTSSGSGVRRPREVYLVCCATGPKSGLVCAPVKISLCRSKSSPPSESCGGGSSRSGGGGEVKGVKWKMLRGRRLWA